MPQQPTAVPRRRHRGGAPLVPPSVAYAVLTILAVAVPPLMAGFSPYTSDTAMLDFFRQHGDAAHANAFFTIGSSIPLAVLVAVSTTRLRHLGLDVPGRIIAQIGGTVAAATLAVAGAATLATTRPHVAESSSAVRLLSGLTYAAGGPAFVVFVGLFVAGVAISGLIGGVLPRPIGWTGIALAVVCEIASLAAAFDGLTVLLPVGRFGSLLWIVVLAFALPANRRELTSRRTS